MTTNKSRSLEELICENEATIRIFYLIVFVLLVITMGTHLVLASRYVYVATVIDNSNVLIFAVFNISAIVVEIYLSRIGFMLASRAGQLKDMRYALRIAEGSVATTRFEAAAKAITSLRRDTAGLKILDIEALISKLYGGKPGGKDT